LSGGTCAVYPPGAFPCLEVIFVVERNFSYFLMQYYITSVLTVILSWLSFWISVDAIVARVNIGLLSVLTLTMQSAGSKGQLPRVSYVKAIDVWMSTCLVFAFASLIEFAIVNVWSRRDARRSKLSAGLASVRRRASVAASAMFGRRESLSVPSPTESPPSMQQQQQQMADGLKPSSTSSSALQPQRPDKTTSVCRLLQLLCYCVCVLFSLYCVSAL